MANWIVVTAFAVMLLPATGWAAPQAKVKSTGLYDPNGCGFWGDSETLSITDNGQKILQKRYCSAYGKSTATIVTDAFSHNFVLLKYAEGHGTNAWTDYLTIYELTDSSPSADMRFCLKEPELHRDGSMTTLFKNPGQVALS